ncbi:MAG: ATP-binding protein, partial [Bdellovibrionota bacterium]|nr:ATP-binding protein [Bdellovibrionota bacterium]
IIFSLGLALKMKEVQDASLRNKSRLIEINQKINQVLKLEVSKKAEALEKKNQRLKEYDFIVAHDLKNPLGAILSYTEIFDLKDAEDPEKTRRIINNIRSIAFRAIDLIDGLLKVVTSGTLELRKHSIELLIKWAASQLTTKINETNAKIKQDLAILSFFCDDVSMEQIFANIIENSIKYKSHDKEPEIIIKSWEENQRVYISFKDNGIGIPEHIKSNVFSKDFRGEDFKNSNIDGYGLGLYHVKNLVKENKGEIEITDTKENHGTTITLSFLKDPS